MLPKKIYLNYVHEDDFESEAEITWSEEPIGVSCCDMLNREYIDLSQIWHDVSEKPQYSKPFVYLTITGKIFSIMNNKQEFNWKYYVNLYSIYEWAYTEDLIPKSVVKV